VTVSRDCAWVTKPDGSVTTYARAIVQKAYDGIDIMSIDTNNSIAYYPIGTWRRAESVGRDGLVNRDFSGV